jgi:hypothetical protein
MNEEIVEKGCRWVVWAAGRVFSDLLSSAIGGAAGMFFGKHIKFGFISGVLFLIAGDVLYRLWWNKMVRAQRNPVVVVILFLIMALALMVGLVFFAMKHSNLINYLQKR